MVRNTSSTRSHTTSSCWLYGGVRAFTTTITWESVHLIALVGNSSSCVSHRSLTMTGGSPDGANRCPAGRLLVQGLALRPGLVLQLVRARGGRHHTSTVVTLAADQPPRVVLLTHPTSLRHHSNSRSISWGFLRQHARNPQAPDTRWPPDPPDGPWLHCSTGSWNMSPLSRSNLPECRPGGTSTCLHVDSILRMRTLGASATGATIWLAVIEDGQLRDSDPHRLVAGEGLERGQQLVALLDDCTRVLEELKPEAVSVLDPEGNGKFTFRQSRDRITGEVLLSLAAARLSIPCSYVSRASVKSRLSLGSAGSLASHAPKVFRQPLSPYWKGKRDLAAMAALAAQEGSNAPR